MPHSYKANLLLPPSSYCVLPAVCPIPISEHVFVLVPILYFSLYLYPVSFSVYVSNSCLCLQPCLSLCLSSLSLTLAFSVFLCLCVSFPSSVSLCLSGSAWISTPFLCLCTSSLTLSAPSLSLPPSLCSCPGPDPGLWPLCLFGLSWGLSWLLLPPLGHLPALHSCSGPAG